MQLMTWKNNNYAIHIAIMHDYTVKSLFGRS